MSEGRSAEPNFTDLFVANLRTYHFKGKVVLGGKQKTVFLILMLFVLLVLFSFFAAPKNLSRLDVLKLYFHQPAADPHTISQKAISVGDDRFAGIINYQSGIYMDAEPLLMSAIRQQPGDPTAHYFLGNTFYELGNLENALAEWRLADANSVAQAFALRAAQADLGGDDAHLEEYARIAVELDPQNGQAYYYLGRWYYKHRALQESLSNYYQAEALAKENELLAKVYRGIGLVFSASDDHSKAVNYIEKATFYLPDSQRYYYYLDLAAEYSILGMYDEAVLNIENAININSRDPGSYINMGDVYALQEEKDKATYWYGKAIEVDPKSGRGEYALGKYLLVNGEHSNAVVHIKRAIDLGWDWYWVRFDLGRAYRGSGQTDEAIKSFESVLSINAPLDAVINSLTALAEINYSDGNIVNAKALWEKILQLDPGNLNANKELEKNK